MQPNLVSIMMPVYNMERYIDQAICSVLDQPYAPWELIIVNDGSTDRTAEVLQKYADPRIRIFHKPNGGEASARNEALKHIQGEFLAFLDADDVYTPDHLFNAVRILREDAQVDGVYSDGFYIDVQGKNLYTLASRRRGPFQGDLFAQIIRASDVFGPPGCVVIRTEKLHGLYFNESILTIGTDWDFWARFAEGSRFAYSDQKTYLYRMHPTNLTASVKKDRLRLDTALCRVNAVHMRRFSSCALEVREFLFYDLLVNLLADNPDRQNEIIGWPEFLALPETSQARLLRLMVSQAILDGRDRAAVLTWVNKAAALNKKDFRTWAIASLYQIHPSLCRTFLRARRTW